MIPPPSVIAGFGLEGEPQPLPGGEGMTVRVGGAVLKLVHDVDEAAWTQELLASVDPDAFRTPEPIASPASGVWVIDGWVASTWLDGLRPAAPDWERIMAAGDAFADAAARTGSAVDAQVVLGRRTHRWAVADRVAWGETQVDLAPEVAAVVDRLSAFLQPAPPGGQIVHGDLTGNVFLDGDDVPVVLDVSPYVRPRRWAAAVVVADAVLWNGAPPSLAAGFVAGTADGRDLLARALVFRLVAEALAQGRGERPRHHAALAPFVRAAAALESP